ncbi:MAG: DUF3108 domain-containing protein [Methyloceanibacter sp.]
MRLIRYVVLTCVVLLLLGSARDGYSREDGPARGQVEATYRVDLAGLNLGEFNLTAEFKGSAYEMEAKGRFSLLAGLLYRASGTTKSAGQLTRSGPTPSSYTLRYKGGDKKETRLMHFNAGAVSQVSITPHKKRNSPRHIPVTEAQLANVLDPLTAAFLSARSDGPRGDPKVCHQTVPVFDGQQRFDLVLSPKRVDSLTKGPAGISGPVAVCRVKFKPIGGYRPDHPGIKFMTETDEIEVWLVSVPKTPLYVPYQIFVPTAWGRGSVTLTEIKVSVDGWRSASP